LYHNRSTLQITWFSDPLQEGEEGQEKLQKIMLRCFINSTSEESWAKGVGGCVGERGEEDEEK